MAAIMIVLKITKEIANLIDECRTLSHLFLPYLSMCVNFEFISYDYDNTCTRIVQSLVQNTLDYNDNIDKGLLKFALTFAPEILQPTIKTKDSMNTLLEGFEYIGFTKDSAEIMSQHSGKFLWSEVIELLLTKGENECFELVVILS